MMKHRMAWAAAAAAVSMAAAGPSAAQNSLAGRGMTIEEVASTLAREGLEAAVAEGGEAGKIYSSDGGGNFEVLSANCARDGRCTEFLFIAGFDLPDGFALDKINQWNAEKLAGRAFLDEEDDPFVDHAVSVSGPQDESALREGLYLWLDALADFMDYIGLEEAGA